MGKQGNYHGKKRMNPALQNQILEATIQKRLKEVKDDGIKYGVLAMRVMSSMVLSDKCGMTKEQIEVFNKEIKNLADSMLEDYVSIPDMVKTLHDEMGFTMDADELVRLDPSLGAYM